MKHSLLTLLFALLFAPLLRAQYGAMTLNPDARSMALGGVTTTVISSSNMIYNNAALASMANNTFQIGTSYYGVKGGNYYAVSGYYQFLGGGALQAGWRRYDYSGGRDTAFDLAYSRRFGRLFSAALTGRYVHYRNGEEQSDNALSVDLSGAFRLPLDLLSRGSSLLVGTKLANVGGYLKGSEGVDSALPVNFTVGAALDWWLRDTHRLCLAVDVSRYFSPDSVKGSQLSMGLEYEFMQFIQIRGGYHAGERDAYYPSYASLGAGIHFMHIRLDLSYLFADKNTFLRNAYSLSFGLDF